MTNQLLQKKNRDLFKAVTKIDNMKAEDYTVIQSINRYPQNV